MTCSLSRLSVLAVLALSVCTVIAADADRLSPNDLDYPRDGAIGSIETRSFDSAAAFGDCACIDLVLVIDDTGSMFGAISNVQAGIVDIVNLATATCTDFQGAVLTFKDDVEVDQAMTANSADVINAVNAITATGGNGEPEASDEALREVVTAGTICAVTGDFDPASLREGCCSVIILVTDARPGGCDDTYVDGTDNANAHQRALEAAALGCQIGALYVPTSATFQAEILPVMIDYANTTNGVFGQTESDGTGTADAIEQVILNCVGAGRTELCCFDGDCVTVTEGDCEPAGGVIVTDCTTCRDPSPVEPATWGTIKSRYAE